MTGQPSLLVGPLLRHVGETDATVWVEADGPCEVEVLGHSARTFTVEGHHYAIVVVDGLERGTINPYEVSLDGRRVWPDADSPFPSSSIRTVAAERPTRIVFGSCRAAAPHRPPFTRKRASDPCGLGIDALRAYALRAAEADVGDWPDALLMLGDQIYADQPSIRIRDLTREHVRDPDAPSDQLEDFEEYAAAYCDAWTEPAIRWLLSTVPSSMIFDDHEIHDEWKVSKAWVEEMRRHDWYDRRVTAGLMTYWLYQHIGNLGPADLRADELLSKLQQADDGGDVLREFARGADRQAGTSRFSFCRDFGRTRLVVFDARAGRELEPGRRRIVNAREWGWIEEQLRGDYEHVLIASSIPFLVAHGLHWFEAWSERVCDGAWGARAVRAGESIRRRAHLGHWAAFQRSFADFADLLERLASGRLGAAPRSIVLLSGDVHHCYLAEVGFRRGSGARSVVWQAVCSGLRKQLDPREKTAVKFVHTRIAHAVARALGRAAGVRDPSIRWRLREGALYANQIATLSLDDDAVRLGVETTAGADWQRPEPRMAFERVLWRR